MSCLRLRGLLAPRPLKLSFKPLLGIFVLGTQSGKLALSIGTSRFRLADALFGFRLHARDLLLCGSRHRLLRIGNGGLELLLVLGALAQQVRIGRTELPFKLTHTRLRSLSCLLSCLRLRGLLAPRPLKLSFVPLLGIFVLGTQSGKLALSIGTSSLRLADALIGFRLHARDLLLCGSRHRLFRIGNGGLELLLVLGALAQQVRIGRTELPFKLTHTRLRSLSCLLSCLRLRGLLAPRPLKLSFKPLLGIFVLGTQSGKLALSIGTSSLRLADALIGFGLHARDLLLCGSRHRLFRIGNGGLELLLVLGALAQQVRIGRTELPFKLTHTRLRSLSCLLSCLRLRGLLAPRPLKLSFEPLLGIFVLGTQSGKLALSIGTSSLRLADALFGFRLHARDLLLCGSRHRLFRIGNGGLELLLVLARSLSRFSELPLQAHAHAPPIAQLPLELPSTARLARTASAHAQLQAHAQRAAPIPPSLS